MHGGEKYEICVDGLNDQLCMFVNGLSQSTVVLCI